ncbi:MAG: crotonobetaine/carnitine-CoA ligase [Coriobacteriia bacterium]|nr:crotonobetaine/carnitine-CoA ligase [Coriobacteriia bacterium]
MCDIVGNETLRSLWDNLAASCPEQSFLIFQDHKGAICEYSYGSFNEEINKAANLFLSLGIKAGQKVAIHMQTCPEFLMCLFGLAKIAAVAVPINEQYLQEECEYVLDTCQIECAIIEKKYEALYSSIVSSGREFAQGLLIARQSKDPGQLSNHGQLKGNEGAQSFESLCAGQPAKLKEQRPLSSDDTAEILFTSGTTSCPKGVELTHANMIFSGYYGCWQLSLTQADRYLSTMPACHSNFQLAALTPVLLAGATLIIVEKYSASRFWEQICTYRATVTQIVSMIVRTLLLQPTKPWECEHSLREILYFLPLSTEEKDAFEKRYHTHLMNTYGSTESVGWVITDPPVGKRNWPSIGRVGLGYEAKIVDEYGVEVPAGEVGEILVKGVPGRSIMKGYYNDKAETQRVLDDQGWLRTDDKGYQDELGWFYFVDRKVNMIKRAGQNISTTELENVLVLHPLIEEAAVIGVQDPMRDQAVKAFVLPQTGASLSQDEVLAYCKEHMAAYKVPSFIEIVDSFPRTCSLKIEKKLLS